jgi:F-type H+-transporting ATPase subunit epsilon
VQSPSGEKELFYVSGGVLEVQPHLITILADAALHASELDEDAALEAKTLAEEALKSAAKKEDLDHAQAQLAEAAARYKAVQKLKGKK